MIIWINGGFGSGKTTCAYELNKRIKNSFVYDPENIGYFLRNNTPKSMEKSDFQDYSKWREFNYEILKDIYYSYDGVTIVPMTLLNPSYYEEIIGKLKKDKINIKHFILYADRETLEKRLRKRFEGRNSWGNLKINDSIYAFGNLIKEEKIITDNKTVDEIVEEISKKSGINLLKDNRSWAKKKIDRLIIFLKHIR